MPDFSVFVRHYTFEVTWNAGKNHIIADALSRTPVFPGNQDDDEEEKDGLVYIRAATAQDTTLHPIIVASLQDYEYQELIVAV